LFAEVLGLNDRLSEPPHVGLWPKYQHNEQIQEKKSRYH